MSERQDVQGTANEQHVDEIVTALYRRFKGWSKRGFGPDDVTWCEVKADVTTLIAASLTQAATSEPVGVIDSGAFGRFVRWAEDVKSLEPGTQLYAGAAPAAAAKVAGTDAHQATRSGATPAPSVKTWQERRADATSQGLRIIDDREFMKAEIADLRTALSAQQAGVQEAPRDMSTSIPLPKTNYSNIDNRELLWTEEAVRAYGDERAKEMMLKWAKALSKSGARAVELEKQVAALSASSAATNEDAKERFEAWAKEQGTYDLRPAKCTVKSVGGVPYDGYVRPYLQDRTVYTYQGFCAALASQREKGDKA